MTCDCDHHETCAVCVSSLHGAMQATLHEQLIAEWEKHQRVVVVPKEQGK